MFYDTFSHAFRGYLLRFPQGSHLILELFVLIRSCHMRSNRALGLSIPELHDMRMVCLFEAVTPVWVTITISFALVIDYNRYCGSFEVIQVKVNCSFSTWSARLIPHNSNKQYSASHGPINVCFMYIT